MSNFSLNPPAAWRRWSRRDVNVAAGYFSRWPVMNARTIMGLILAVVGAAVVPFGYWISHVYYFVGFPVFILGVALALRRKQQDSEWSPDLPDVPIVGELRGFHGSDAFDSSSSTGDGGD